MSGKDNRLLQPDNPLLIAETVMQRLSHAVSGTEEGGGTSSILDGCQFFQENYAGYDR